jgi:hypothetical protein
VHNALLLLLFLLLFAFGFNPDPSLHRNAPQSENHHQVSMHGNITAFGNHTKERDITVGFFHSG